MTFDPIAPSVPPTYRIHLSYEDNYREGPFFQGEIIQRNIRPVRKFIGFDVNSTFGVPAGPLLNSKWIKTYAELGFDLLVYKTVRTRAHPAHPAPNCLILNLAGQLGEQDFGYTLVARAGKQAAEPLHTPVSITNSFGMPSKDPEVWQEDVRIAKSCIQKGQVLIVSVVGTPRTGEDLAEDYARGALMAKDAGADMVEINLSCPNVTTGEGSLYSDPEASSRVAKIVHRALRGTPLILKMGYLADPATLEKVILANAPYAEAISSINTLSFKVVTPDGNQALPGPGRLQSGVCGDGIRSCGLQQSARIAGIRSRHHLDLSLIGVGGIMTVDDILAYENAGMDGTMSATGAMWDPFLALKYYRSALVHKQIRSAP